MNACLVFVEYRSPTDSVLHVHLPPLGLVPPPPDAIGHYLGLRAACGAGTLHERARDLVGYGETALVVEAESFGVPVEWCPRCYPQGRPA